MDRLCLVCYHILYKNIWEALQLLIDIFTSDNKFHRQLDELIEQNKALGLRVDALLEQNARLIQQNEEKDALIASLSDTVDALNKTVADLNSTIAENEKANAISAAKIAALEEKVKEQEVRLHKNSHNSSKPPSSDGLKKPKIPNLRTKTGKSKGGQPGHEGKTLEFTADPTETIRHMAKGCAGCPHAGECTRLYCTNEARQVTNVSIEVSVIEHRIVDVPECPMSGGRMTGEFPKGVNAPMQYGTDVLALAATLNTEGAMGADRVHQVLGGAFGIPLSPATVLSATKRCAEAVTDTYSEIGSRIADGDLAHFDETSTRMNGTNLWAHAAATDEYTHLSICDKRGEAGMREAGILQRFKGVAVTDCWSPYWAFVSIIHALCCAHLLRELIGIIENYANQSWAKAFKELLLEMKSTKERLVASGKTEASYYYKHKFSKEYDRIIQLGHSENPEPPPPPGRKKGRKKKGKVLALIVRLEKHKADVCRFFDDFSVPFDNNEAERSCRIIKVKTKVSGCFRTKEGAQDFAKVQSYTATGKKHGIPAYEAIRQAFLGNPDCVLSYTT